MKDRMIYLTPKLAVSTSEISEIRRCGNSWHISFHKMPMEQIWDEEREDIKDLFNPR